MKKTIAIALTAGALAFGAASAQAKPFPTGGVTAPEMAAILKASDIKAEVTKDDVGDPMLKAESGDVNWRIYFYDCTDDRCKSIQFSAGFDLDNGMTYAKTNEWNFTKRFSRAALDDDMDPYVRYDIDAEKGFTTESATLALETWQLVLASFTDFIGYNAE